MTRHKSDTELMLEQLLFDLKEELKALAINKARIEGREQALKEQQISISHYLATRETEERRDT